MRVLVTLDFVIEHLRLSKVSIHKQKKKQVELEPDRARTVANDNIVDQRTHNTRCVESALEINESEKRRCDIYT